MPHYDYKCTSCGYALEQFQSIKDAPLKKCPGCSQEALERGFGGGAALLFKGSGFYKTDYCKKESGEKTSSSNGGGCGCSGPHSCK